MFNFIKNPFIFLTSSSFVLMFTGTISIDLYEQNNLLHLSNNYFSVFMGGMSCNKLKLANNGVFVYLRSGNKTSSIVFNLERKNGGCEFVIHSPKEEHQIIPISYKIGRGNVWSQIFK